MCAFLFRFKGYILDSKVLQKSKLILQENPIWKGLIILAFPVFLANILKTLHDIVDTMFIGMMPDQTVATQMQAAIGLTWPIFFIFISIGLGLSVASNGLIGQFIGKEDYESAKKFATNSAYLSIILGVLFTLVVFLFAKLILRLMGVDGDVLDYATTYLRIRSFELPVVFLMFAFQAIRRATGDTTTPVVINSIAIAINIALTALLILVYQLGITGAAIATLIGQWVMLPIMVYYFIHARSGIQVTFKMKYLNYSIIDKVVRVALPASAGQSLQAVGFVILNSLIYSYGENIAAAFFIGNRITSLVMFPVSSITSIIAIYVAQNIGAGNIPRAKRSVREGISISVIMMTVGIAILLPFSRFIVGWFSHDASTIPYAIQYMFYIGIGLPLMALFQAYLSTFQGSGDTHFSLILAVVRLWIFRLPFVLLTMHFTDWGPLGVWYSMLASNILAAGVGWLLYTKVKFTPRIRVTRSAY